AYSTEANNVWPGRDDDGLDYVVVRSLSDNQIGGPPPFGKVASIQSGPDLPTGSDNGNCVLFSARGHNALTGPLGDFESMYVYVRRGACQNPETVVPTLTKVTLKPAKFRVSGKKTATVAAKKKKKSPKGTRIGFNLNVTAT